MSLRTGPLQGSHTYTGHTRTRVAFWECVHEWMPLCPLRYSEQEEEEKTGGSRGYGEGSRAAHSFSTAAGTRRALSALTCPYVDPSRELSDLTWSSSKRFSRSGPLARLFFVPKNGWDDPTWLCPPFLCLFLSHSCVFFPLFFNGAKEHCAFSGAFQSQTSPLWRLVVERSSSSIDARASFGL